MTSCRWHGHGYSLRSDGTRRACRDRRGPVDPPGLDGESPIVPRLKPIHRAWGIRDQQPPGSMVPQPDSLVMTVAGQKVPRVAELHVGDPPVVATQDAQLSAPPASPRRRSWVVARGRHDDLRRDARPVPRGRGGRCARRSSARRCENSFRSWPESGSKSRITGGSMGRGPPHHPGAAPDSRRRDPHFHAWSSRPVPSRTGVHATVPRPDHDDPFRAPRMTIRVEHSRTERSGPRFRYSPGPRRNAGPVLRVSVQRPRGSDRRG